MNENTNETAAPPEALPELANLDLHAVWNRYLGYHGTSGFLDHVRTLVSDPNEVDEWVGFCDDCSTAEWTDDLQITGHGTTICDSCRDEWWRCDSCEQLFGATTTTLNDTEVCESCRDNNWTYCDHCDGYRHDNDYVEHEHASGSGCCESPEQSFVVRNDGEEPLVNDTRVVVTLPAGVISDAGIDGIRNYLLNQAHHFDGAASAENSWVWQGDALKVRQLAWRLKEIGDRWQAKDGNYTKRLSRFAYKNLDKLKLTQETVSQVGCLAREQSTAVGVPLEVTRDLNLPREEFYHDGSCWWTDYAESRCALKTNGGFGLRTFTRPDAGSGEVSGRAWVMPLKRVTVSMGGGAYVGEAGLVTEHQELVPTFETLAPDAFVVFNGYGDLEGYAPARIVAHMAGWTYRKIGFACEPMYVNNGSAYLVAAEETVLAHADNGLSLSVDQHSDLFNDEIEESSHDAA